MPIVLDEVRAPRRSGVVVWDDTPSSVSAGVVTSARRRPEVGVVHTCSARYVEFVNVTARGYLLALSVPFAAVLPTACTEPVSGRPAPATTLQPPATDREDAGNVSPRTSLPVGEPRIPRTRSIAGVDPCSLLAPPELAAVGGAIGPPHRDEPLPGSCTSIIGGGPEDSVGAGFHVPYQEAVPQQPRGVPVDVDGHSAWLYCEILDEYQTCTAVTAIRDDASLLTLLSKHNTSAADATDMLYGLTRAALRKLPSQ